jgi:peptidyl-prolyl cis-trans isomerase C
VLGGLAAACSGTGAPPAPGTPGAGEPPAIDRAAPLPSPIPEVVARVNGRPIYLRQIVALAREELEKSRDREKDKPGALRHAMQQYVARELLLQEALARRLTADEAALERAYDELRLRYRDEKAWTDYLAAQGHTPQSFREELRIQQTVQSLVNRESLEIRVSEEEARAYLAANPNPFGLGERLTVSRILVRAPEGVGADPRAQARVQAELALHRIRRGADFATVAREVSQDEATREKGGRLPELAPGDRDPRFEAAAFALQPGEVSDVIETGEGFEIVKLHEKRTVPVSFEQVADRLVERLLRQKRQAAFQQLVSTLRARAKIETYI